MNNQYSMDTINENTIITGMINVKRQKKDKEL